MTSSPSSPSPLADQYDPLIKHMKKDATTNYGISCDCVLGVAIICFILVYVLVLVLNDSFSSPVKLPIRLNSVLSKIIPVNSSFIFEYEGTKYEIVLEGENVTV